MDTSTKRFLAGATLSAGIFLGIALPARADHAGEATVNKPVTANPAQIREGASLFRANCSACHGLSAQGGGRGPDLTSRRWIHGSTDAAIFRTISQGVPGTEVPANNFEDSETRAIIAYLWSCRVFRRQRTTAARHEPQASQTPVPAGSSSHAVSAHRG